MWKIATVFVAALALNGCLNSTTGISTDAHYKVVAQSAGKPWSIQQENNAYIFEVRPGDWWRDSYKRSSRSEISILDFAPFNAERWYKFSIYLPEDVDWEAQSSPLNRLTLGQIHNGDNGCNEAPPIKQHYYAGTMSVDLLARTSAGCGPYNVSESYRFPLPPGKWHDFAYEVRFDDDSDGYVRLWVNGHQVIDYKGPFGFPLGGKQLFNRYKPHHYLKLGIYKQFLHSPPVRVKFKDISVGRGKLPPQDH